ncbi:MAG: glycosyltransferase [Candidatus Korobacteraceae bacterium]
MNSRVLVIGPSHQGALPESYARAFERLGMEVFRFDDDRALFRAAGFARNRWLRRAFRPLLWWDLNRAVLEVADAVRPALIFAVRAAYLEPETVARVRQLTGVPFVNHYPDNPYIGVRLDPREASTQRRNLIDALRQYSTVWMWERSLVRRLLDDRVAAEYLPFAVDPELFHAQAVTGPLSCQSCGAQHKVVFVGTCTRARRREITAIHKHSVAIWGNGWPRKWQSAQHQVHAPVYAEAVARIHAAAQVSLNVLNAESLEGHNMRTFEVPASGGVMLARYTAAQDELFPENEAAAYYRSPGEIDAKIDRLLADGGLRERIRRNGLRLAASETYDHRAAEVLRHVGLAFPAGALQAHAGTQPR